MIETLLRCSPEFASIWAEHDVAFRRDDRKRVIHPSLGLLEVNCLNLFSEDGRQRLLWFAPALGTDSVDKLGLPAVIGTQALTVTDDHPSRPPRRPRRRSVNVATVDIWETTG